MNRQTARAALRGRSHDRAPPEGPRPSLGRSDHPPRPPARELAHHRPQLRAPAASHRKVEGQREAVDRVTHQKGVRAVAFEDREKRRHPVLETHLELVAEDLLGAVRGNKALVLDETAGEVDLLPVRHVVEEKGKGRQRLPVGRVVAEGAAGEVLGGVDAAHPGAVGQRFQEPPHQRFRHDPEHVRRQVLRRGVEVRARFVVLPLFEMAREVQKAAAEVLAAGKGVDPADDVLPPVLGIVGQAEHGLEVRRRNRPDLDQPRADPFQLQPRPGDDAELTEGTDNRVEEIRSRSGEMVRAPSPGSPGRTRCSARRRSRGTSCSCRGRSSPTRRRQSAPWCR